LTIGGERHDLWRTGDQEVNVLAISWQFQRHG
jgi:hypothetical protein